MSIWNTYSKQLYVEYLQCVSEGKDIEDYSMLFDEVIKLPDGPQKDKIAEGVFELCMAAFNLDDEEKPVTGSLSPAKLPNFAADKYLAYDFFTGEAEILKTNENIEFTLNNYDDFKFYNFIPVEDGFAPIGLTDKYITSASFNKFGKNKYTVLNGGIFAFYSEKAPKSVLVDGEKVSPKEKKDYYTVDLGETKISHILEFEF